MALTSYRARWVIPVTSPPIPDGRLVVEDDTLRAVERARGGAPGDVDLGDVAVVPGFVNAHTHLELTGCEGQVPFRGSFVGWLEDLVGWMRRRDATAERIASVRQGLDRSVEAGVTLVGDIGSGAEMLPAWETSPVPVFGFLEVTGMGPRRFAFHEKSFRVLKGVCEGLTDAERCRIGLSPHAPYSVAPEVYRAVIAFARATGRLICTHLAETMEELQFLAEGRGAFRDLLERWGLWDGSFEPPGCSPVAYAERLGLLAGASLLCHVNYVSDEDLETLAEHACHVVFCPRSHAFFGHAPHPYARMRERGIGVCIGTDSLASNKSLSVLDELRFLHGRDPHIDPDALLAMGTVAGARALRCAERFGSLEVGKRADWVAIPLSDPGTDRPVEDVLERDRAPAGVYVGGRRVSIDG